VEHSLYSARTYEATKIEGRDRLPVVESTTWSSIINDLNWLAPINGECTLMCSIH